MSGSNIKDISEQTHGKETELTARDRGRKDKSCDVIANMEARLAKVELAMVDTREGLDFIEHGMEKDKEICIIKTWEDFKREIKRQFYPENVAYLAKKNIRHLKHIDSIRDYVKKFPSLMLEIPNMTKEKLLFNFMDNL
uniref:Retrotransposon gag domain-containing protein n=1 Tax=Vitis vinifera TaxID=29760 RepID=A5AWX0_VITVI|nr:hypothetical protein VITISV_033423 [Vitis vinifera]